MGKKNVFLEIVAETYHKIISKKILLYKKRNSGNYLM